MSDVTVQRAGETSVSIDRGDRIVEIEVAREVAQGRRGEIGNTGGIGPEGPQGRPGNDGAAQIPAILDGGHF